MRLRQDFSPEARRVRKVLVRRSAALAVAGRNACGRITTRGEDHKLLAGARDRHLLGVEACTAATAAEIDPDRIKFLGPSASRPSVTDRAAFSP
ncbi:hypothetical protein ACQP1K_17680 [Sphaerimonospora sp. CA-214678]|uniref:hypothetical protein n=1 Tax=Sphaerimonospora sp. CA-214678 TaxID=3240029 RepID=UPI003D92C971